METNNQCHCSTSDKIVLGCSGASDLGQLTDITARKLRDSGICKMNCLALAGAGIATSIKTFKEAELLVIDGCSLDCGKIILDKAGIKNYLHLRLTNLGYIKGQTSITEETIFSVLVNAKKLFSIGN
jgi:uncharacterized metal-binding protein